MEVSQALADLEEVRARLTAVQRFRGLSGSAALASGLAAFAAGAIQALAVPHPTTHAAHLTYVSIWIACLAFSLAINYGAIVLWVVRHWSRRSRGELRTVGMTILPAILAGGIFTAALIGRDIFGLLPGTWCICYALGLLASRAMAPSGTVAVAALFAACGGALLFAPASNALAWWVMPATFGIGQAAMGALVWRAARS